MIIFKLIIKLIKMICINNLKNKIIVEKNNNKNIIKIFILYEFFALILSLISGIFLKSEYIIYIFIFYTGIIICRDKNDTLVKMTLPEDNQQIFASRYMTVLPSKEELKKIVEGK